MTLSIIAFLASAALLIYLVIGYPLILHWIAHRNLRPVRKDSRLRSVSIVIAVHNGEPFLGSKLESILGLNYPRELMQIIVVSDGSDDRTEVIAREFRVDGVQLIALPRGGKASALNAGIQAARNEILVLTDVRQRLESDSIRNLVACFGDSTVGAVSGQLEILEGSSSEEADTGLYWRYEIWIRKNMSRLDSTFGCNGPFYAMRRSLAVPIPSQCLPDDLYLPFAAFFQGYRLTLEDSAKAFDFPTSLNSEFGRKVRTQAGHYQILGYYPRLLTSANRMRFHFLSAKFGRLLLPYLLIVELVASFGLPGAWKWAALTIQAVFYGLAAIDPWVPQALPLKRLSSPIRSFCVIVASPVFALAVFFVSPQRLWKKTTVRHVQPAGTVGTKI